MSNIAWHHNNIAQTSSIIHQYSRTGHSEGLMFVKLVVRGPHCQVLDDGDEKILLTAFCIHLVGEKN